MVGTVTLGPTPLYTNTGLGGGAVGEVAFGCHLQDCDPPYVGSTIPTVSTIPDVELVHYGPVTWGSGAMPAIVSKCDNAAECQPGSDIVTGDWEVINQPGERSLILRLKRTGQLLADHHYHFQPVRSGADQLSCHGIAATGVPVRDYLYTFNYEP